MRREQGGEYTQSLVQAAAARQLLARGAREDI